MAESRSNRILRGRLAVEVARFGTPLALGMALQTTFNLVDAYLVAQLPAAEVGAAVGAIGICDQIAAIGTIVSYGVSTAAAVLLSQRKGAGDQRGIQRAAWQSLLIVVAMGIVFGVVGGAGAGFLVREVIGAKGDVAKVATSYLRVAVGGGISIYLLLLLTNIQRALGSSKTPVALLAFGNLLNVLIAILLMYGAGPSPRLFAWAAPIASALHVPRLGMLGAAWASVIARSIVLVPSAIVLVRRFDVFPPRRAPDRAEMKQLLSIAWPSSAQFVVRIAAMLLVNSLVARFFTTAQDQTATTAMGLVFRLDTMALFVAMGWGSAAQTFVGQNLGAEAVARARRSGWITALYDAITNVLLVLLVYRAGEAVLRVFDDDTAPVSLALDYLRVVSPSYLALGVGVVLGNAMAGAGATRTTLVIDSIVVLGFQLPISIVVAARGSLHGLFACVAASNVAAAILYASVYARGGWVRALAKRAA